MERQKNGYQCLSPERVAQLLSLGVGYEGYIEFKGGYKMFVIISPDSPMMINQQYIPLDTVLSVYVTNPENPQQAKVGKHWSVKTLKDIQIANGAAGLAVGGVENFGAQGTMRFTQRDKLSLRYYKSGWRGGIPAKIKTYKVETVAAKIGERSFLLGVILDALSYPGEQSLDKLIVNTAFEAIGAWGGPAGFIVYGLYFVMDLIGAFDGHVALPVKDPMDRYIHPADATRVEPFHPIESIPQRKPQYRLSTGDKTKSDKLRWTIK